MNRVLAGVACVALAASALACGGDDAPTAQPASSIQAATAPPELSPAAFRDQVSAICEAGDAAIAAKVKEALQGEPTAAAATAIVVETVIPTVEGEIAHAEALAGPADLEAGVRQMTASVRVQLDHLRAVATGPDPFAAFVGDPFAEAHALAAQLGFTGCRYVEE